MWGQGRVMLGQMGGVGEGRVVDMRFKNGQWRYF